MSFHHVFFEGVVVGEAEVISEGLYYRFRCRCTLPTKAAYRLTVTVSAQQYDLGICVPDGAVSVVDKRIPAKNFQKGEMVFCVSSNADHPKGILLAENKPFPHIKSLLIAKLQVRNGVHELIMNQDDSTAV